jgi:copper transport protein
MTLIHRLSVFRGSLLLISIVVLLAACGTTGSTSSTPTATATFHSTLKTTDGKYVLQFSVTPNRLGLNVFTLGVEDATSGKPASTLQAQLSTTMLDMDMGTDQIGLQPNGHGQYSAQGTLSMAGRWEIRILLHAPDATLHGASVEINTQT